MIPEEKNPKVLSTEELLARFNAQKAGTLSAVNKNLDPWGSELVDIDSMLGDQKEPTVPQTKPVAQGAGPETEKKQGIFPYLGKKLASSVMGLGEMVMETPQAIEALSNAPAVMLTEAMIKRKLRKGEIDQETGDYLMKEAATITPRRTITGNMVNTDTMPGEVLAEGDLNTWFESNKDKFSNAATRYDQTATEYLKSGQFGKALGAVAGGVAESAAPTLAAMFIPGGAAALGIGVGSQSYDDVKDREDMAEGMKIADAVTTGVFEWLFERFGSREMGKALMEIYQKAGKKGVQNAFTSPGMQNLIGKAYKKFGVWFAPVHEGISEGLTTLGQNAAAIVSGEDPERDIADGFWDSVLIGAGMGGTFSLVEKAAEKHKIYREGKAGPVIEPLTVEEQDPEQIVRDLGRKYAYNGFNDQLPEQNFVKYGEMKDGRKVIIKSTNFATDPEQMLVTVVDAENPESKTEMVKGTMIVNSMDVPYEEWVANEMKNYQATKAEVNNQVGKASAPVQEGATIPIGEQLFNVTQVTPEGITLNEIDKEGNLTANTQVITPDQYGEVFGVPTEQTAPIPQPEIPAAQMQAEMQPQAEQPVAEQGQPATTATVSPQSRKISDGKNEFTILPQEDGNYRMSESFETQKEAETALKKLQERYPKLTWKAEMTDSGDMFTPDTYNIVAEPKNKPVTPAVKKEELTPAALSVKDETGAPSSESIDTAQGSSAMESKNVSSVQSEAIQTRTTEDEVTKSPELTSESSADSFEDIISVSGKPNKGVIETGYNHMDGVSAIEKVLDEVGIADRFQNAELRNSSYLETEFNGIPVSIRIADHTKRLWPKDDASYILYIKGKKFEADIVTREGINALSQRLREVFQSPSLPDETAAEEEMQKAGEVETTRAETAQVDLAEANAEVDIHPTDAQKDAGNYKKGHLNIAGLDISIENPAGTVRSGVDNSGKKWSVMMNNTYGYFRRTEGKDGDQVDVFLGDNVNNKTVFVVDQSKDSGIFDEVKVMLGFNNVVEAANAYLANYEPGWKGMANISETDIDTFKDWLNNGDTKKAYKISNAWTKVYPGISSLVTNEGEMPKPEEQKIQVLRGNRNKSMPGMADQLPEVSGRRGEETISKSNAGQDRPKGELLQGELPVDRLGNTGKKPEERQENNLQRQSNAVSGLGNGAENAPANPQTKDNGVPLESGEGAINPNKQSKDNIKDVGIQGRGEANVGMGTNNGDQLQNPKKQDINPPLVSRESTDRPIKKLSQKKGWPMSKADEARLSREPQSFEEAVYMFFLGRGRISMNDYYTHFGKNPTERLKNIWMYSKDGIKLDKLNEVPIFEANPNLLVGMEGAMDQANAFVAAIRGVIGGDQ